MKQTIDKVINPYSIKHYSTGNAVQVYIHITYKDGKLSITGVEGPYTSGDCYGSCGQILMSFNDSNIKEYSNDYNAESVAKLMSVWKDHHLNDLTAGSPAQEQFLKETRETFPGYPVSHFKWACELLEKAGLQPDENYLVKPLRRKDETDAEYAAVELIPYSYGSRWLHTEVPAEVIAWLDILPCSTRKPAWV